MKNYVQQGKKYFLSLKMAIVLPNIDVSIYSLISIHRWSWAAQHRESHLVEDFKS